jgi:hypothetical protein
MKTDNGGPVVMLHKSVERFKERLEPSWNYLFVELESDLDAHKMLDFVGGVMKQLNCHVLGRYHLVDPGSGDVCIVVKTRDLMNLEEISSYLYPVGSNGGMVCYLFDKS